MSWFRVWLMCVVGCLVGGSVALAELKPITEFDGPTLEFDFPGFKIGCAEYEEGPTGCTVFLFDNGVQNAADIRGGSPGVTESEYGWHNAICFAGGSLFGLEAPSGVRRALFEQKGGKSGADAISLVSGAIIYDWFGRDNFIYPDTELGYAAAMSAVEGRFPIGRRGAGRSAGYGQGAAFRQVGDVKIAVFTVVNALGKIHDRDGNVVAHGNRSALEEAEERIAANASDQPPQGEHTTLTLVITNRKGLRLDQYAKMIHSSMARAIQPFHTDADGDVLYLASTNEVDGEGISPLDFGIIASEVAWDAVISAAPTE